MNQPCSEFEDIKGSDPQNQKTKNIILINNSNGLINNNNHENLWPGVLLQQKLPSFLEGMRKPPAFNYDFNASSEIFLCFSLWFENPFSLS